jgi:hypothetical protein
VLIDLIIQLEKKLRSVAQNYISDTDAHSIAVRMANAAAKGEPIDWSKIDPMLVVAVVKAFARPICK